MKFRLLGRTGLKLSILGMGGSGFGNVYGNYNQETATHAVKEALDRGVNYIDTAYWYGQGQSELFLGRALRGIKRENFIVSTKVCRYEQDYPNMFDFSAETVNRSAYESLKRLQLDHIDILQIHDVEFAPSIATVLHETLPALQRLKDQGLCRYIGITGYPLSILRKITEESTIPIDCVLSYCRLTLNDTSLIDHFHYFNSRNVGLINASPIGMGLLTPNGVQPWHPASADIKSACAKAMEFCQEQGVDIAQLAINFSTSFKEITTTLVSMNDDVTVGNNIAATLNPLTKHEAHVRDCIIKKYFSPLKQRHWEGVEVEKYKKQLMQHK
ncbi:L-galactose dehydrogenase [Geodia barretti]|uniref:L-galactose dehydrogenase n=1 Tax=Geodia barretti TaxID=519541 RepID=A0AA35WQR6_GEOBA|nr:L-galactose dehydrogenase [Geodia barretti]